MGPAAEFWPRHYVPHGLSRCGSAHPDPRARDALALLELPARTVSCRSAELEWDPVGEALSLFIDDLHFGGGAAVGCQTVDAHFDVRMGNPLENGACQGRSRCWTRTPTAVQLRRLRAGASTGLGDAVHLRTCSSTCIWCGRIWVLRCPTRRYAGCWPAARAGSGRHPGPHMFGTCSRPGWCAGLTASPSPRRWSRAVGHASLSSTRLYTDGAEAAGKRLPSTCHRARSASWRGGASRPRRAPGRETAGWRGRSVGSKSTPAWRPGEYRHTS